MDNFLQLEDYYAKGSYIYVRPSAIIALDRYQGSWRLTLTNGDPFQLTTTDGERLAELLSREKHNFSSP